MFSASAHCNGSSRWRLDRIGNPADVDSYCLRVGAASFCRSENGASEGDTEGSPFCCRKLQRGFKTRSPDSGPQSQRAVNGELRSFRWACLLGARPIRRRCPLHSDVSTPRASLRDRRAVLRWRLRRSPDGNCPPESTAPLRILLSRRFRFVGRPSRLSPSSPKALFASSSLPFLFALKEPLVVADLS